MSYDRPFQRMCTKCKRYRFMAGGITQPKFICKTCREAPEKA